METDEFIEVLEREGQLLGEAARIAGTGAPVPSCPAWRVRDLVAHTGVVHRFAARFVAEGLPARVPPPEEPGFDGDALLDWYRDGHRALVRTLTEAPPDVDCFAFLPAPTPLAFWARRQAHETAVHRVDAETAAGAGLSPFDAGFAADGIDELLAGFHSRPRSRVRTEVPYTLRVRTTDTSDVWTVHLTDDVPRTVRDGTGAADCELRGTAADLYLALWNRPPVGTVGTTGDEAVARLWRETSAITFGQPPHRSDQAKATDE
ncbi:maleylpyruvate isomerase family mycothiol-dependent enzyme [Streptomyces sp. XD-27]|uniref:maleylpyruvate isomerase family mycothiol-dependent enzyme n=1 Tax=Streptomyces sp. XD-27 TaxID=3062779 RepID=UPI0026F432AE|nr:maleylpyruvate isomerase family mycothiol-dependent enzyme [Streptomyces sp. XD-27]WKX73628.1 maleylpyruvate isomerase family mycothiol-dependent enzyme [Streptomyces sp. XD-27]